MKMRYALALVLVACGSEQGAVGPAGEPGEAGAQGAQGPQGEKGIKGDSISASDGGASVTPAAAVKWTDATGQAIPVATVFWGALGDPVTLYMFDATGLVWFLRTDGFINVAKIARRYFMSADCSGAAYTFGIPARVTFGVPGVVALYYPDSAKVQTVTGIDSYKESGSDTCIAQGFNFKTALLLSDAIAATPPTTVFSPPFRIINP